MKKLLLICSLIGQINCFSAVDLVRVSELPVTNVVTTNDIMLIVTQPFTSNAVTRRIIVQDLVDSLILPQIITTNITVNNIYTTNIVVGTNAGLIGYLTYPKLPYANSTNELLDSPISVFDSTTVAVPSLVISNSVVGVGSGTNFIAKLTITNYLHLPSINPGSFLLLTSDSMLTNGVSNGTNTLIVQSAGFTTPYYPVASGTNTVATGRLYNTGTTNVGLDGKFVFGANATTGVVSSVAATVLDVNGTEVLKVDASATANDTRLLLWDVTAGSLRRVTIGAADSGGAGFRVLRIPN
jgi:hypothetical protein